jgi:chorismate synthase
MRAPCTPAAGSGVSPAPLTCRPTSPPPPPVCPLRVTHTTTAATAQVKYGTRASSGGGRASARETIGRVAAGAIAEKWLRQEYGTEVVTFVSAVGTVALPPGGAYRPDGAPWTRADVDELGTLTLLRDAPATGWKQVAATAPGATVPPAAKAGQDALDAADEAAFLRSYNATSPDVAAQLALCGQTAAEAEAGAAPASAAAVAAAAAVAPNAYAPGTPAYEGADGVVYDMHGVVLPPLPADALAARRTTEAVCLRCPHGPTAARMASLIRAVKAAQDSTGGVLTTIVTRPPVGLGEPVFDKAEAMLAHAMLSLPATKGFEIGDGFAGSRLRGSVHNDAFVAAGAGAGASSSSSSAASSSSTSSPLLATATNHAGGTLGGITSGGEIVFRVPIKPVSTIGRGQATAGYDGSPTVLEAKGRHDPCVLPRAPPLVEGMTALVLADLALIQRARAGGPLAVLPPTGAGAGGAASSLAGAKRKAPEGGDDDEASAF